MRGLRKLLKIAGLVLLGAAIAQELGKPPNERTWRGQLDLAIPYDLTVPTPGRLREAYWNPQDDRIFTDKVLGVGWAVNAHALLRRMGLMVSTRTYEAEERPG